MKAPWGKPRNINQFVFQIISETKEKVLLWDDFWSITGGIYWSKAEGLCVFWTLCMPLNPKLSFLNLENSAFDRKSPGIMKSRVRMFSGNPRSAGAELSGRKELAQSPLLMAISTKQWGASCPKLQQDWLQRSSPGWNSHLGSWGFI